MKENKQVMRGFFTTILFLCLSLSCVDAQTFPNYIAHAGGAGGILDDRTYSNSREALLQSIERGYTFIEMDLDTTSDGVLVAVHDWSAFHNNAGRPELGDSIFSLESFRETRIYGEFTPITMDEVVDILNEYPSVFLVTDKISDPKILDRSLSSIRDRVYVEAFSLEDFKDLRAVGYRPMYSHGVEFLASEIFEQLLNGESRIDFIVNFTGDIIHELRRLRCLMPLRVATYTSNSLDYFEEHLGNDADLIYTDYYNPSTGEMEEY